MLSASLAAQAAHAQSSPEEERRAQRIALIRQANQLRTAGRLREALEAGERAEQFGITAGTRMLVGQLRAAQGDHVGAHAAADDCIRLVLSDTQTTPENRRAIQDECSIVRDAALRHVGRLVVRVPMGAPAELVVRAQEDTVRAERYGVEIPMAPGTVTVRAELPGQAPWSRAVVLRAGGLEVVDVRVPGAQEVGPSVDPAAARLRRSLGWASVGVGGALLAGGAVATVLAAGTASDYDQAQCETRVRNEDCVARYDQLGVLNALQWVGFAAGGALAVTGVVLLVTAPRAGNSRTAGVTCAPTMGTVGVRCEGRF